MRATHALLLSVLLAASALAAPPAVEVPAETVASGDYVTVVPKTDAKAVSYLGLSGVDPFPSALLKDSKTFVLPVRGLAQGEYRFAGVASLNDEHTVFYFKVRVGKVTVPPVDPPGNPPVDPPTTPTSLYFMIVREDGPASPAFTRLMSLPAWATIRGKGHSVKDFSLTDARKLNAVIPAGTVLPAVIVLKIEGGVSRVVRPAATVPADPLKLLE